MPEQLGPFTYGDVSDMHRRFGEYNPYFKGLTLSEFADLGNRATGTQAFSQALKPSAVKAVTHAIDRFLRPVSKPIGELGAMTTRAIGLPQYEKLGRQYGEDIPRSVLEALAIFGGLSAGGVPGLALAGLGAASMGAKTYEQTGSGIAGLLQAGLGAAMPGTARAGTAAMRPLLRKLGTERLKGTLGGLVENAAEIAGRETAMAINNELAIQGTSLAATGQPAPLNAEHVFSLTAAQLPFILAGDVPAVARRLRMHPGARGTEPGREFRSDYERAQARQVAEEIAAAKQTQEPTSPPMRSGQAVSPDGRAVQLELFEREVSSVNEMVEKAALFHHALDDVANKYPALSVAGLMRRYRAKSTDAREVLSKLVERGVVAAPDAAGSYKVKASPDDAVLMRARELIPRPLRSEADYLGVDSMWNELSDSGWDVDAMRVYEGMSPQEVAVRQHRLVVALAKQLQEAGLGHKYKVLMDDMNASKERMDQLLKLGGGVEELNNYVISQRRLLSRVLVELDKARDEAVRLSGMVDQIKLKGDMELIREEMEREAQMPEKPVTEAMIRVTNDPEFDGLSRASHGVLYARVADFLRRERAGEQMEPLLQSGEGDLSPAMQRSLTIYRYARGGLAKALERARVSREKQVELEKATFLTSASADAADLFSDRLRQLLPPRSERDFAWWDKTGKRVGDKWQPAPFRKEGERGRRVDPDETEARLNDAVDLLLEGQLTLERDALGWYIKVKGDRNDKLRVANDLGFTGDDERKVTVRLDSWLRKEFIPRLEGLVSRPRPEASIGGVLKRASEWWRKQGPEVNVGDFSHIANPPLAGIKTAQISAREWFRDWWRKQGLADAEADSYADIAARVAAVFEEVGYARIGTVVTEDVAGQTWSSAVRTIIGLHERNLDVGSKEYKLFRAMVVLGHELGHNVYEKHPNAEKFKAWVDKLSPDDRGYILSQMYQQLIPEKVLGSSDVRWSVASALKYATKTDTEFAAEVLGLSALGVARPDLKTTIQAVGDTILLGPSHLSQFMSGYYLRMVDILGAVEKYLDFAGLKEEKATIHQGLEAIQSVLHNTEFVDKAINALRDLENKLSPESWAMLLQDSKVPKFDVVFMTNLLYDLGMKEDLVPEKSIALGRKWLGFERRDELEKEFGVRPGFMWRNFGPSAQLAAKYPVLRPAFDIARTYFSIASDVGSKILSRFLVGRRLGRVQLDVEATGIRRLLSNEAAERAASRIGLKKQVIERVMSDDEMRAEMRGLSKADQDSVIAFHRAAEEFYARAAEQIIVYDVKHVQNAVAHVIAGKNPDMRSETAKLHAARIMHDVLQRYMGLPQRASADYAGLPSTDLTVNGIDGAVAIANAAVEKVVAKAREIVDKPWFMTEMRLGRYMVGWKEPAGGGMRGFNSQSEAVEFARELRGRGITPHVFDKYDRRDSLSGLNKQWLASAQAVDTAIYEAAMKHAGLTADQINEMKSMFTPLAATMKEIAERGVERFSFHRKLRPGREHLNMVRGTIEYIRRLSTALALRFADGEAALAFRDPTLRSSPALQQLARDHYNNVAHPTGREYTLFKQMNFMYWIALNLSTAMVEGTQTLLTFVPQITRDTGKLRLGYTYLSKGVEALFRNVTGRGLGDPDLQRAVDRATRENRFGTIMQEFYDVDELAAVNTRALLNEGTPITAKQLATKPLYWLLHSARWLYGNATRANSLMAFVASYKLARDGHVLNEMGVRQRMTPEQAYQYAANTVDKTLFGGGPTARPVGMFARKGELQGVVGVMYSLATYTFSTIAMMARLGSDMTKGLPGARKAFGQMLLTQAVLGGALSLPFVKGVLAVMEQYFPELELNKSIEDAVQKAATAIMNNDDEWGSFLSDVAMRGVPSRVFGVDLSSRIALSNIMGISPYDGFSLANLVGPTGGVIENIVKATQHLQKGEFVEAARVGLPVAFKNLIQYYRDDGVIRDNAGRPLINDMTNAETAAYLIGLRPTRLTRLREIQHMAQRSDDVVEAENRRFFENAAKRMIDGDIEGVKEALFERQAEYEGFSAAEGARRVVEEVLKRTEPIDIAREGVRLNASERQRLAAKLDRPRTSEVERLMRRRALQTMLGVPVRPSRTELRRAQIMDQLMAMNPLLARQQAADFASLLMQRR